MRVFVILITILILPIHQTYAKNCLDIEFLQFIKKGDPTLYNSNVFTLCIHNKQCKQAKEGLSRIKNLDQVLYSYLYGTALANGDCFPQNLREAEKHLAYCAQYSEACKTSLLHFYFLFAKNKNQYEKLATDAAFNGDYIAISFLVDLYNNKKTAHGYGMAYMFLKLNQILLQNELDSLKKQGSEFGGNEQHIANTEYFLLEINNAVHVQGNMLNKKVANKLDELAYQIFQSMLNEKLKTKNSSIDYVADARLTYGVTGVAKVPVKNTSKQPKKLAKINPPQIFSDKDIKKYERLVLDIMM